jgi:hypothetical protein
MTDQQKATQENQSVPFGLSSCIAMMKEMLGQQERDYDGAEMMSQMMGQGDCAAPSVMSRMMASCCGMQGETEEEATKEATQEA